MNNINDEQPDLHAKALVQQHHQHIRKSHPPPLMPHLPAPVQRSWCQHVCDLPVASATTLLVIALAHSQHPSWVEGDMPAAVTMPRCMQTQHQSVSLSAKGNAMQACRHQCKSLLISHRPQPEGRGGLVAQGGLQLLAELPQAVNAQVAPPFGVMVRPHHLHPICIETSPLALGCIMCSTAAQGFANQAEHASA